MLLWCILPRDVRTLTFVPTSRFFRIKPLTVRLFRGAANDHVAGYPVRPHTNFVSRNRDLLGIPDTAFVLIATVLQSMVSRWAYVPGGLLLCQAFSRASGLVGSDHSRAAFHFHSEPRDPNFFSGNRQKPGEASGFFEKSDGSKEWGTNPYHCDTTERAS